MATNPPEPKVDPKTDPKTHPGTDPRVDPNDPSRRGDPNDPKAKREVPDEVNRGIDVVPPGVHIPETSEESPPVEHKTKEQRSEKP